MEQEVDACFQYLNKDEMVFLRDECVDAVRAICKTHTDVIGSSHPAYWYNLRLSNQPSRGGYCLDIELALCRDPKRKTDQEEEKDIEINDEDVNPSDATRQVEEHIRHVFRNWPTERFTLEWLAVRPRIILD